MKSILGITACVLGFVSQALGMESKTLEPTEPCQQVHEYALKSEMDKRTVVPEPQTTPDDDIAKIGVPIDCWNKILDLVKFKKNLILELRYVSTYFLSIIDQIHIPKLSYLESRINTNFDLMSTFMSKFQNFHILTIESIRKSNIEKIGDLLIKNTNIHDLTIQEVEDGCVSQICKVLKGPSSVNFTHIKLDLLGRRTHKDCYYLDFKYNFYKDFWACPSIEPKLDLIRASLKSPKLTSLHMKIDQISNYGISEISRLLKEKKLIRSLIIEIEQDHRVANFESLFDNTHLTDLKIVYPYGYPRHSSCPIDIAKLIVKALQNNTTLINLEFPIQVCNCDNSKKFPDYYNDTFLPQVESLLERNRKLHEEKKSGC